jgi:hypothetical protein
VQARQTTDLYESGCPPARSPEANVHAQPWTFEKDMSAHRPEYAELARRVTSVCLRSWKVPAGGKQAVGLSKVLAGHCRKGHMLLRNTSYDCSEGEVRAFSGPATSKFKPGR